MGQIYELVNLLKRQVMPNSSSICGKATEILLDLPDDPQLVEDLECLVLLLLNLRYVTEEHMSQVHK